MSLRDLFIAWTDAEFAAQVRAVQFAEVPWPIAVEYGDPIRIEEEQPREKTP